jgi:hypothetical protein
MEIHGARRNSLRESEAWLSGLATDYAARHAGSGGAAAPARLHNVSRVTRPLQEAAFNEASTSSSIFLASPNSMRLLSL